MCVTYWTFTRSICLQIALSPRLSASVLVDLSFPNIDWLLFTAWLFSAFTLIALLYGNIETVWGQSERTTATVSHKALSETDVFLNNIMHSFRYEGLGHNLNLKKSMWFASDDPTDPSFLLIGVMNICKEKLQRGELMGSICWTRMGCMRVFLVRHNGRGNLCLRQKEALCSNSYIHNHI